MNAPVPQSILPTLTTNPLPLIVHWRGVHAPRLGSLLAALVAAIVVPSALLAFGLVWWGYRSEVQKVEASTLASARTLAASVDRHFLQLSAALDALGSSPALATGDVETFHRHATAFLGSTGLALNVFVIRPDGTFLANSLVPPHAVSAFSLDPGHPQYPAFQAALAGEKPVFSNLYLAPLLQRHVIAVGMRVHATGAPPLVIVGGVPAASLDTLLDQTHLQPGWTAGVLDRASVIAARLPRDVDFVGQPATDDLREHVRGSREGVMRGINKSGMPTLGFYSTAPVSGYVAVIGIPEEAFAAPLCRALWLTAGGMVLVLALSLLAAFLVARRIASSAQALAQEAKSVWRGRSAGARRLSFREADEVRVALNIAAAELQQLQVELREAQQEHGELGPAVIECVLEAVGQPLLLLDGEMNVFHGNGAAESLFGLPMDRLAGMALTSLLRTDAMAESMLFDWCKGTALKADGSQVPVRCRLYGRQTSAQVVYAAVFGKE